jgi:hypothetical protein
VRFCGNEVTPTELPNRHPRPFYRQAIPTGLAPCPIEGSDIDRRTAIPELGFSINTPLQRGVRRGQAMRSRFNGYGRSRTVEHLGPRAKCILRHLTEVRC